ncbi:cytochrome c oxidase assembly protein [Sphingobium phenoxybenzoativorans]|uniref:Cytochrome c oxidase assembly protein n=1 Tax=Sphingobium phenoxybenzoativorans TaxID=1592790 RepID=A0A975K5H8_9SPHN|nr:cytochrome c oxidase assembly protein [Sphingobium phenoxybenzoativorans]QUT05168.1 cytochrome c oxidase assembly protein [Sphingobium phenoxybenzoativorans]
MRQVALISGFLLLPTAWLIAVSGMGMIGHMGAHMIAVAVAAPLIAYGLAGTRADPAVRWPSVVAPMAMMLIEFATVWLWHAPAARAAADASLLVRALEQLSFGLAGLLLWSSVLKAPARASGIGALLLTSMHMTLLGVLIGLAPRTLYSGAHGATHGLDPLTDQQLGGVIMLLVGAAAYFLGGLALLASLLRHRPVSAA